MAKPSTAPVAASCAEPTRTGEVGDTAVVAIKEAFAAMVRSNEAARNGPEIAACWGSVKGSVSGPLPLGSEEYELSSPEKLNLDVTAVALLLTSVNVVVQFSCA